MNVIVCRKWLSDWRLCVAPQLCIRFHGNSGTLIVPNRKSKLFRHSFHPNVVSTIRIPSIASPYASLFRSGHDCGVFVMAFMDVLSIRTDGLYFHQRDVRHMRDLCLLSIIQGEVAHFPDALLGTCVGLFFPCTYPITEMISRCLVVHVAG